jgi:hypothetical protein
VNGEFFWMYFRSVISVSVCISGSAKKLYIYFIECNSDL